MTRDDALDATIMAGCKFAAINAIAKRAKQITGGAPPLIDNLAQINRDKPAMTAMREIALGRVRVVSRET